MAASTNTFQGFGNSIYDIATGLKTLNDPNASQIAIADATATITNAMESLGSGLTF